MAEQLVVISTGSFSSKYKILSHENKIFIIPSSLPPSISVSLPPLTLPPFISFFYSFNTYTLNDYSRLGTLVETGDVAEDKINMLFILSTHILIVVVGGGADRQLTSKHKMTSRYDKC